MLTLLTVTGDRPQAFALCERWMARQTLKPDQWVVVDDGITPTACTMGQDVIRLPAPANPCGKTFARKFIDAIKANAIRGDVVAFIEDDDWYAAEHLETLTGQLGGLDIAGEAPALYYHVGARGYRQHANSNHASLCQTAIDRRLLPMLYQVAISSEAGIDLALWQAVSERRNVYAPRNGRRTCIGIKGMPGRAGLGSGHQAGNGYTPDADLNTLRGLIGDDAEAYAAFANDPRY